MTVAGIKTAWTALDGKKTILGYAATQVVDPSTNIVSSIGDALTAWLGAFATKDFTIVVHPTLALLSQLLLLAGVGHKVTKLANGD